MDQVHINFRLKYITLLIGVAVTSVTTIMAGVKDRPVSELIALAGTGTALTALVYTAINSQFTSEVHLEQLRLKKLENAMTFIEYSSTPEMVNAVNIAQELRSEVREKTVKEIASILEASKEKKRSLIMIFNYFERLGIVVRLGTADEQALRDYYHTAVKRYWQSFKPWIEAQRNDLDNTLFAEMEALVDRWK